MATKTATTQAVRSPAMRPHCVHCGKAYGIRVTENVPYTWPLGAERPQYTGNRIVAKDVIRHTAPHDVRGSYGGQKFGPKDNVGMRTLWDGESYFFVGKKPFCSLKCALEFARIAYEKGFRS